MGAASISFPVTFGFSMSNYYENGAPAEGPVFSDTFGYFDVGGVLVFPLEVMPEGYGDWELSGGFHLLSLGELPRGPERRRRSPSNWDLRRESRFLEPNPRCFAP